MVVTINTDASFSRKYKVGSYAFWIKCNEFDIKKSGILRKKISRAENAEFRCIINALHNLFTQKTKDRIGLIVINTDCMNVIHLINDDKLAMRKYDLGSWGRHMVLTYNLLRSKHKHLKTRIEFRHVKAHKEIEEGREFMNDWCDKEAKKQLGDYIEKNYWKLNAKSNKKNN